MRPRIVLFGDSITEASFSPDGGWGAALADLYSRYADVVLRGYSGYNTRWALRVFDRAMEGISEVAAATVFFGANDASLPDRSSWFQHVPLPEYRENLAAIVRKIKERWADAVVLLITPPPVDEDGRVKYPFDNDTSGIPERTNESACAYAKACLDVAKECGVPVIDVCSKMQELTGWEKTLLSDGLHLTSHGSRIVFEEVAAALKVAKLGVRDISADLPLFSSIDPKDPMKSFGS